MAERTIKIEIPVEVQDNTAPGTSGVVENLSRMEKAFQKVEKQQREYRSRMEKSFDKTNKEKTIVHKTEIVADDNATPVIKAVEDAAYELDGVFVDMELSAQDNATQIVNAANDAVEAFGGTMGWAELGADDSATPVVRSVEDAVEALDGASASAELGASDTASPVIDMVRDKLHSVGGMAVSAVVGAADTASAVIDGVTDKLSAFSGTTWNATIGVIDTVTAPLGKVAGMAKNPIAQAAAIGGVSFGVADTVSTFGDFESMMSQVKAISGASGAGFDALTAKAKEMGATTKFTAAESAEAMNYMAMAGWKTEDMLSGIEGIMNLAAASGEDLGSTSDIVTDALTAFGMQAGDSTHFADVLAQASANANTNVGLLGESFKYVAPVAGAMNYSVEDTSIALGLMANASIKGSMAGTALKTSIANMASPTDSMAKAMDKYGISLTDSEGNMKSLKGVMDNLRTSLGGLSETEQTAAASAIFGKEAMAGMLAVINASAEDFDKLTGAVYDSDGAAKRMSETMLDNLQGSFVLMQSALDGVKTSLGERLSPYLRSAADAVTGAMPAVGSALDGFMDMVDEKAEGMKRSIHDMTSSEEWANADFLGKINLSWNKIIAEPFLEWAGGDSVQLVADGVGTLFSSALGILPGGEKAGIASWMSTALLAKGATGMMGTAAKLSSVLAPVSGVIKGIGTAAKEATGLGSFIGNLSGMVPTAAKFGLAAAAVTAAVVGIGTAIDDYNQNQISSSLEDHFGDIRLSAEEAQEIAAGILDQKYLANVEVSLNEVKNADRLVKEAEEALRANDVLEFKGRLGIELTPEEQQQYTGNIETFINSEIDELESRTFAASIHVQTYLGGTEEGETLSGNIEKWARADHLELTNLSEDLRSAVETALLDGIIDVDEEQAISELQAKMNGITARWKEAEAQAKWDWINQEYGSLNAADLESGSFTELLGAVRDQRESAMEAVREDVTAWYAELNGMEASGRITAEENDTYHKMTEGYVRQQRGMETAKGLELGRDTLQGAYGGKIAENRKTAQALADEAVQSAQRDLENGIMDIWAMNIGLDAESLSAGNGLGAFGIVTDADQNALNGLWQEMKPDSDAMTRIIDSYAEAGEKVPEALMKEFTSNMEMGAAAGDADAAMQVYANALADSGNQALIDAIGEMDAAGQLPEEFSAAWKRALLETTDEEYSIEGLKTSVDGEVDIDKEEWLSKIQDDLGDLGTVEGEADGEVKINVKKGDTLSQIGDALGIDWREIAAYNGIEDPYTIYPDMELKIPTDMLNADTSEAQQAAEEALQSFEEALSGSESQAEITTEGVQITLGEVEVDGQSALEQIAAAVNMEADELAQANGYETAAEVAMGATITVPEDAITFDMSALESAAENAAADAENPTMEQDADVNLGAGDVDASQAREEAEAQTEDEFAEPLPADADVDMTMTHNNSAGEISRVYSEVNSEVQGKFVAGFSASADVAVTLDWHITNPSASINVSAVGGSAFATIAGAAASAEGRYVDGPLLSWIGEDGPEFVIPVGAKRRERGIELWEQAGRALGVAAYADGGIVGKYSSIAYPDGAAGEGSAEADKTDIPVNTEKENIQIQLNFSPSFEISRDNPQTIAQMIKAQLRESSDDLINEVAERVAEHFANMPV
ncbi:phage tail tape measure protein, TP901 family [Marvinbryantia formatexigens DSM 14469]|uniref:Phage tail tape measure protein, TP901 family n=1 Tax=Marvinbryantia formatexigens DSM 14469 TaxID=478749 RepID=C6LG64_9FIRM|nr:phage tail tape measure protein [Marvinbryantia formatexigens]EET60428.1 phage tail tape measure protein, TP901 family [Marvinbryantia formatexigens DSM 14469]UWO25233.1 phage tail tape measure protein [Marvinbryantia formatexigens DSM 14469]SDH05067.1 phage tail tape measure protein, TP901 family, core region [Marvinbryantia formatexigens]